jgi:hypothetical protein
MKSGLSILLWLLVAALPSQAADYYRTYVNSRFGTVVQYPASFLEPRPEADNGDGRRFVSKNEAIELTVYAFNNTLSRSVKGEMSRAISDWKADGARLTYQKSGTDWYTLSGYAGDDIFYEKTLFKNGVFHTLIWQYPKTLKARLDAPVTRTVRSFTAEQSIETVTITPTRAPSRPKRRKPQPRKMQRKPVAKPPVSSGGY